MNSVYTEQRLRSVTTNHIAVAEIAVNLASISHMQLQRRKQLHLGTIHPSRMTREEREKKKKRQEAISTYVID